MLLARGGLIRALGIRKREVFMRRVRVKPSKEVSLVSVVGGMVMVVIGVIWAIPTFGAFGVAWTIFALAITGYHAFNAFSSRGVATQEIDVEGFDSTPVTEGDESERLQRLESLRARNLITEEEYERKRAEIIERL
jgi:hypothetical protein